MLDFASSLYLGLRHASSELRAWAAFSTGMPAVLGEPPETRRMAADLAALTGVARVTLARSTLHAFWDVFGALAPEPGEIFLDEGAYPIARWGTGRAAARGVAVRPFPHHDAAALRRLVGAARATSAAPWIVTDGFCGGCGRFAPLADYLAIARESGARLVLDDTQAVGIFGRRPSAGAPYGLGGGGSLAAISAGDADVLLVASLAKAFGAPLAFVGGPRRAIERFEAASDTRVHASPPSVADLRAAEHALDVNRTAGDLLRLRLAALVARFRRGLRRSGLRPGPSLFPVQAIPCLAGRSPVALHGALERLGVRAVLRRPACRPAAEVALVITAAHSRSDIDACLRSVNAAIRSLAPTVRLRVARAGRDAREVMP